MELDKDLQARQEARELAKQAEDAQKILAVMPQEKAIKALSIYLFPLNIKEVKGLYDRSSCKGQYCSKSHCHP